MNFYDYITTKIQGINLPFMSMYLNMDYQDMINIISGNSLPNYQFLVKFICFFRLNNEEQLCLFALAGEIMGVSPNQVFEGVAQEIALMTTEVGSQIR